MKALRNTNFMTPSVSGDTPLMCDILVQVLTRLHLPIQSFTVKEVYYPLQWILVHKQGGLII